MSEMLPLFPLGTVLYPGLPLPLHIFEERYRQLVRDLLAGPEPPSFGVVAIREGRESAIDGVSALWPVGCTAVLRQVQRYPDGRYDIVTVGARRFRLLSLDESKPYWQGEVEMLAEDPGDEAAAATEADIVRAAFSGYLRALSSLAEHDPARGEPDEEAEDDGEQAGEEAAPAISIPDLPAEPVALSYAVAASLIVDLADKQALLAQPDAAARLAAERVLLAKETTMLRRLTSAPAPHLRYTPYSNN
jgi:Lon protease-like protein